MSFVELPFTFPKRTMKLYSWVYPLFARRDFSPPSVREWFVILNDINFAFHRKELKEAFRLYDKEGEENIKNKAGDCGETLSLDWWLLYVFIRWTVADCNPFQQHLQRVRVDKSSKLIFHIHCRQWIYPYIIITWNLGSSRRLFVQWPTQWYSQFSSPSSPFTIIYFIEMIAEIDTDSSGTVDFDGECFNLF